MLDGAKKSSRVAARSKGLKQGTGGLLYMMGEGTDSVKTD